MKKEHNYWVYIVTNRNKTVLYTGVTNNLCRRLCEHYYHRGQQETFAGRYYCYNLLYHEWHQYILNAIAREKEIKNLLRAKKINELIEAANPEWQFLNREICPVWPPDKLIHTDTDHETIPPPPLA